MERYEKIRVIGQGAFGKVFLLRRKYDNINVVIKQIPVDDLPIDERRASMNEVSVLKMLQHPNIVAYYDSFVEEKSLMIAMEYAPGGTLYEFINERSGKLLLEEASTIPHILQLFVQILVAIQHVHSLNILHRDLKPQNIMLNKKRSVVKIGDFGISKVLSSLITSAQTVVGTPCYISPEICEGKAYRKKSDIWAMGCILYELATLKKAFEGPNLPALVFKIMQASEGIPQINNKKYSRGLQGLITALIQRNPDDRPNTDNIMGYPILVNALVNLGTDVGRLPCTRVKDPNHSAIGVRMGSLGGSYRQKSFFDPDDYYSNSPSKRNNAASSSKTQVLLWGGGITLPIILPLLSDINNINIIAIGRSNKMAVTDDGRLIKWELSKGSIATTGLTISSRSKTNEIIEFIPKLVGQSPGSNIILKKACCGDMFTACLTDKGILMTFGSGVNGCLGHCNYDDVATLELVAKTLEYETVDVACGTNHVISLTADNTIFGWGRGESGQLGTGCQESYCIPQLIQLPLQISVKKLLCGPDCSILITDTLSVYATGSNKYNKLGLDPTIHEYNNDTPILSDRLSDLTETSMIMSTVFKSFSDISVTTPTVTTPTLTTPGPISHIDKVLSFQYCVSLHNITDGSVSYNHSAFINSTGKCITSGHNNYGQLGRDGHNWSPGIVERLVNKWVKLVSCGDTFTTACTNDGEVYTWGQSNRGRLGREDKNEFGKITFDTITQVDSIASCQGTTIVITNNKDRI